MPRCDVWGNDYDKDSFECAIHRLAPVCDCARRSGVQSVRDRAEAA